MGRNELRGVASERDVGTGRRNGLRRGVASEQASWLAGFVAWRRRVWPNRTVSVLLVGLGASWHQNNGDVGEVVGGGCQVMNKGI